MSSLHWFSTNWFEFLSAVGVVGGLVFTGYSLRSETKTRRIANLLKLTEAHRELWKEMLGNPHLKRVLNPHADLSRTPVSADEELFVILVIQHVSIVFHAYRDHLTIDPEGFRRDVWQFFSMPIPLRVWESVKVVQNKNFVEFIDACLEWR